MKVKIVASKPANGQDGITGYIGHVFKVISRDREQDSKTGKMKYTGRVSVNLEGNDEGESVLQPGEYVVVK